MKSKRWLASGWGRSLRLRPIALRLPQLENWLAIALNSGRFAPVAVLSAEQLHRRQEKLT